MEARPSTLSAAQADTTSQRLVLFRICVASENCRDTLAGNHIQERKRRSRWSLRTAVQLGHITRRHIQMMGKHRLAHPCALAQCLNLVGRQWLSRRADLFPKVSLGDFRVSGFVKNADTPHILSRFEQRLRQRLFAFLVMVPTPVKRLP